MNAIEKARDIIAMGEHYDDAWAKYEEMTNPGDLLPLLRLLVECEEVLQHPQRWDFESRRIALLDKLRSESYE